jgi:hypothetical protein
LNTLVMDWMMWSFLSKKNDVIGYMNNGDGTFSNQIVIANDTSETSIINGLNILDMNGDDYEDLLIFRTNQSGWIIQVYHNRQDGTFEYVGEDIAFADIGWYSIYFYYVFNVDIDSDGDIDLVIDSDYGISNIVYTLINDNGSFSLTNVIYPPNTGTVGDGQWLDVDGDSDLDYISNHPQGIFETWYGSTIMVNCLQMTPGHCQFRVCPQRPRTLMMMAWVIWLLRTPFTSTTVI